MDRERPERRDEVRGISDDGTASGAVVLERAPGRSGELVLRRHGEHLEIIFGGTFLISTENLTSSVALIEAGLAALKDTRTRGGAGGAAGSAQRTSFRILIGGLGLGYALDTALCEPGVGCVTVAEYEPVIVEWFREHGQERAERLGAAEATGRARIVVGDVADVMRATPRAFDLVALDTDNGPDWLVREENAGLYDEAGLGVALGALRPNGVVAVWSPERYDWFAERLAAIFARVEAVATRDHVGDHTHEYTMYVARRE